MNAPLIKLTLLATVLSCAGPCSQSANGGLAMGGSWNYSFGSENYFFRRGADQSGRYSKLNKGYYEYGYYGYDGYYSNSLLNTSRSAHSGPISVEFWQTPVYGGSRGYIKMTRGFKSLKPGFEYTNVFSGYGYARLTGVYGYYVITAWNYSNRKWRSQDRTDFSYYTFDD